VYPLPGPVVIGLDQVARYQEIVALVVVTAPLLLVALFPGAPTATSVD